VVAAIDPELLPSNVLTATIALELDMEDFSNAAERCQVSGFDSVHCLCYLMGCTRHHRQRLLEIELVHESRLDEAGHLRSVGKFQSVWAGRVDPIYRRKTSDIYSSERRSYR
jgi:hypothetical protein